jgi:hypothetical protein
MPPKRKPKPPPPPPVEISSAPLEDEDDATVVVVATVAADDDGDVMKSHRLSTPRVSSREMTAFEDAPLAKPKPTAPPLVAPVTPTPTTPAPPSSKKPRIDTSAITGVRVIACLAVLCQHWIQWYGKKSHGEIELQVRVASYRSTPIHIPRERPRARRDGRDRRRRRRRRRRPRVVGRAVRRIASRGIDSFSGT